VSTLRIRDNGERVFTNGKAKLFDSFIYASVWDKQEDINKFLLRTVPHNSSLPDLEGDILAHKCDNPTLQCDDNKGKCEVGFKCTGCGTRWMIPLPDVKASITHYPKYRCLIRTTKSRAKWLKKLEGKK